MKHQGIIIVAVVILAIVILAPTLISTISKGWSDAWSNFWSLFSDLTGGETLAGYSVIIQYKDGTEERYDPSTNLIPQTIVDLTGKEIASVTVELYMTVWTRATISSWTFTAYYKCELYSASSLLKTWESNVRIDSSGAYLGNGTETKVWTKIYTASTIESMLSTWEKNNEYTIRWQTMGDRPKIVATFTDGSTETKEAAMPASCGVTFQYIKPEALISLNVEFGKKY